LKEGLNLSKGRTKTEQYMLYFEISAQSGPKATTRLQ